MSKQSEATGAAANWNNRNVANTYGAVNVSNLGNIVFTKLIPHLRPGAKVLDIGCGDLRNTLSLKEHCQRKGINISITGTDFSQKMVDAALENGKAAGIKAFQANASNLPIGAEWCLAESYDAVVSVSALHWIPNLAGLVKSIAGVLKPGGVLVTEFGYQSPPEIREALLTVMERRGYNRRKVQECDPWWWTTRGQWNAAFDKNGFADVSIEAVTRIQPLENETGMYNWLKTFVADSFLKLAPEKDRDAIMKEIIQELRDPKYKLCKNGNWEVHYERFTITAQKEGKIRAIPHVNGSTLSK